MDRTLAALKRYLWLGNRVNTDKNPITEEQLHRFGRHPHGSVPELCVEVKRLPSAPSAITATPDGEICTVTVIDGMNAVVCGQTVHMLTPFVEMKTGDDPNSINKVEVLGFVLDRIPVTKVTTRSRESGLYGSKIFVGSERHLEKQRCFHAASLTAKGELLYWAWISGSANVYRDNELIGTCEGRTNPKQFFECPNGEVVYLMGDEVHYELCTLNPKESEQLVCGDSDTDQKVIEFRLTNEELIFIRKDSSIEARYFSSGTSRLEEGDYDKPPCGRNSYISGYLEFPGGGCAYIGETARDHLQCMVVNGEPQPSFEKVSPLVQRDSAWRYYGLIGQHVYTMEIPEATK